MFFEILDDLLDLVRLFSLVPQVHKAAVLLFLIGGKPCSVVRKVLGQHVKAVTVQSC